MSSAPSPSRAPASPGTVSPAAAASPELLASMTGFARVEGSHGGLGWTWEARSVNGRSLDLRVRLAGGYEGLEPQARAEATRRFKRGSVSLNLTLARAEGVVGLRLNRALLGQVLAIARELEGAGAAPPRLDALLAVRGIIEPVEAEDPAERPVVEAAMAATLGQALDLLAAARAEEGARLRPVLGAQLDRIAALVAAAGANAASQPAAVRQRLRAMLDALFQASPALPEERLAQEAALLLGRADVREELDRLIAHVEQARDLLAAGGAVGRRLDFLCQEFNREANTLCSKAADVALVRIGLDLKATIEQFREQVQNIE